MGSMSTHRPLTRADLLPRGPLTRLGGCVLMNDTLDSTNALLLSRAAELPDGSVAWAEYQTAGRGRFGRRWEAPRGSSILLSVLLHEPPQSPAHTLAGLLGALAACEAVETTTDCTPAVRWPNDIVLRGRKLGGVLAESCLIEACRAVVIGIGLNCWQHAGHFSPLLAETATSLERESAQPVDRAGVAAGLLARLDHWTAAAADDGAVWMSIRSAWRAHCADLGTRITLEHDGRSYAGTAIDVSADGDLIIQLDEGGRRAFAAATTTRRP